MSLEGPPSHPLITYRGEDVAAILEIDRLVAAAGRLEQLGIRLHDYPGSQRQDGGPELLAMASAVLRSAIATAVGMGAISLGHWLTAEHDRVHALAERYYDQRQSGGKRSRGGQAR